VVDLPAQAKITNRSTAKTVILSIALPLKQPVTSPTVTDPVVNGVSLHAGSDGHAVLTVSLDSPRKCHVFTVPAAKDRPFRLVVDVPKTYTHEEHRKLSAAITYTRLEKQTDNRYFVAHIVEIDARKPGVHFAVTQAKNRCETVSSMTERLSAVCGVNGGFFLEGTRPVGMLKVDGDIRCLPIWHRSAVAFPSTGLPVFANVYGVWKVTLPDGSVRKMADWIDFSKMSPTPSARVIPGISIAKTFDNPSGLTVVIRHSKVVACPTKSMPLQPDEFALHITGKDVQKLRKQLTIGASVKVTAATFPEWHAYPDAVGAGPRLLKNGTLAIAGEAKTFRADILSGRAARTGIGVTKNGHVVLAVVEAPGKYGGGATLRELAALLQARGACDAMNLDGGGSSCLALGNETVNYPPHAWVRPVASGVLVFDETQTHDSGAKTRE
jgi:exopolysaccharide biosynthesis protein